MRQVILSCVLVAFAATGCSGNSPVAPDNVASPPALRETVNTGSNHVLWGIWDVSIDPAAMTAEVVPIRGAAFTCNVTQFMQPPSSPVHMVNISIGGGSDPATGFFEIDITLNHPFPGMNQFNGFDVRGILLTDGSVSGDHDSSVLRGGPDDTCLLNADGYTRWWNYPEFTSYGSIFGYTEGGLAPPNQPTATVNPYRYFAEGLDAVAPVADLDPSTRGFFPTMPGSHKRTYEIQFKMDPTPVFDFQYAVDASWEQPDPSGAPNYPQDSFPLSANCQEAYTMSVSDAGSTAYYVGPSELGGELVLDIEVYDWQAAENPGGVPAEVAGIWLEGPILGGAFDVLSASTILPGSTSVSSVYEVTIGALDLTQAGVETLFCTVESASPSTYQPQVPGGENFDYPDSPLAAYFTLNVLISDEPPGVTPMVLAIDPDWGFVDETLVDVTITGADFDPACSVTLEFVPGDEISGDSLEWIDAGTLEVDLDLTGATLGLYDVIVENPFAAPGVLEDGFEVKEKVTIWPVTQGNRAHSGMIGLNGPSGVLGAPSWNVTYADVGKGNALPVFLNEDTAFFTIAFNYLQTNHLPAVAVNLSDHSIKWTKVINESSASSVVVLGLSEDGTVVLVWDWPGSYLYGLDAEDGSELWQLPGAASASSDAYPTLDLDGNFIMPSSSGFKSIDPETGTVNWTTSIGNPYYCTPAVGTDGTIYGHVGLWGARIHAIDPATGASIWVGPAMGACHNSVVFNPVTETIICFGQGGLYCLEDNGSSYSLVWQQSYSYPWYSSTSVADNGDIYLFDYSGTLRRIDPNTGATLDSSSGWGNGYGSRPAIGLDGLIYSNSQGNFRCFNADCSQKWSYTGAFGSYWSGPAIGLDGTVYSVKRHEGLCAWQD